MFEVADHPALMTHGILPRFQVCRTMESDRQKYQKKITDADAMNGFLRAIHYHDAEPLREVTAITTQIFYQAGQPHLLALVKLRQFWLEKVRESVHLLTRDVQDFA